MRGEDDLYSGQPAARLRAARGLSPRAARRLVAAAGDWPSTSPGACNAWLLLVTSKPPTWRDPLISFPDGPPTLGEPHEGFLYPDPIGFWAEVRRWVTHLLRGVEPSWGVGECLSLAALIHVGGAPEHLDLARRTCRPRMTVFLDEPAWAGAGLDVVVDRLGIPDPHRPGQTYEGWWGTAADGTVVGKAPQHPTMHRVYRAADLSRWLDRAPRPR